MIGSAIQEHTSPDSLIQPALSASPLPGWLLNDRGGQFSKIDRSKLRAMSSIILAKNRSHHVQQASVNRSEIKDSPLRISGRML